MPDPTADMIHDRPSDVGDRSMMVIAHPTSRALGARQRSQLRSGLVTAAVLSSAQGGSWLVRTRLGQIDGFLSDVTKPNSRVLTIEAGHVGCPALTPEVVARGSPTS